MQLFAAADFDPRGTHDILFGPGAWPSLQRVPTARMPDWSGAVTSLITGPSGRVTLWEQPDFAGSAIRIAPGEKIPDLPACKIPPVQSLQIECRQ